jgi:hypothetical protein
MQELKWKRQAFLELHFKLNALRSVPLANLSFDFEKAVEIHRELGPCQTLQVRASIPNSECIRYLQEFHCNQKEPL